MTRDKAEEAMESIDTVEMCDENELEMEIVFVTCRCGGEHG